MADGIRIRTLLSPGVPRGLRAEMFKHQQDLDAVAQDLQAARDMVEAGDLQRATADRLFDAMTDNTDNAKRLMDAVKALVEALGALADALTLDGYAASVRDVGDGSFAVQLCQGNCPVRDVAGEFHELCDAETQAISRLVGVPVQRLATLAGGEHVCTTHIPIAMPALRKRAVRAAAKTRGLETKRMEGTR